MEALLTAFVGAALAEWGDKTHFLVMALAARFGRPGQILAGVALAALAGSVIAAVAGSLLAGLITIRALTLLVAVALLFAGIAGLIGERAPERALKWTQAPFLAAAIGFFFVEFGDRSQFLTFALAARYDSALLAALGATAGLIAASVPAALLGDQLAKTVPMRGIKTAVACLFVIAGIIVAIQALRLI